MQFNKELAERAIKEIEARPGEWRQERWRCDTGMCFAGHVAHVAGAMWKSNFVTDVRVVTPSNEVMHAATFAAKELGLGDYDPETNRMPDLFDPDNTIDDLKELIEEQGG